MSRDGSLTRGIKPLGSSTCRLPNWVIEVGPSLDQMQKDMALIDIQMSHLQRLLENIELQSFILSSSAGDSEVKHILLLSQDHLTLSTHCLISFIHFHKSMIIQFLIVIIKLWKVKSLAQYSN